MLAYGKTGTAPGTTTLVLGSGLGVVKPTDFDRARGQLDYLPYYEGWLVGNLKGPPEVTTAAIDYSDPNQVKAAMAALEVQAAAEDIKHKKSSRLWLAIGGIVGIGTLVVGILALRK
jgi:hypothetical protein